MFLARLEIVGFKSFPERTEVRFGPGITGIVGPNGCGKTNILDAIRWVMGEQRPTLLRGGRMDEVIFNGAPGTGPMGMAEVSLTIENNRGILPVEYAEVVITRRLFRSGESEYLLNRVPCRLKDIVELFLDTGMGSHAYAVFQQTMVDALLSEKPEDRIGLFEEAAGVAKYKLRRRAAERKLATAETDLVRLNDLFSEIERQFNALKRQVKKAERFKSLDDEKRSLKIGVALFEYRELKAGEENAVGAVRALEVEEAEIAARKRTLELEKESQLLQQSEKEGKKRILEEELSGLGRQLVELEGRRALLLKESENYSERKAEFDESLVRLAERKKDVAEGAEGLIGEKENLTAFKLELEQLVVSAEAELNSFAGRLSELAEKKQEHSAVQEKLRLRRLGLESEKKVWTSKVGEMASALESLSAQKRKLQEEFASKSQEKVKLETQLSVVSRELTAWNEKIEGLEQSLAVLGRRKDSLDAERRGLENLASELGGRISVLEELERNYGGYEPATREILSRRNEFPGLVDSLANLISAEEQYLGPIEAALGERAQAVVMSNWEEAVRATEILKEKKLGRARFLVLPREDLVEPDAEGWPGAIGWASDLVGGEGPNLSYARRALENILIVQNRETAFRLATRAGEGITLVTLDAEVLGPGGFFAGGESRGALLVGRKAELERLKDRVSEIEVQKSKVFETLEACLSKLTAGKENLENSVANRNKLAEKKTGMRLEFEKLSFETASLDEKVGALDKSGSEFAGRRDEARKTLARLEGELADLQTNEEGQGKQLASLEQELEKMGKAEREKQEFLTRNRMELISALARLESTEKDLLRLTEESDAIAAQVEEKQKKLTEVLDIHENFDIRMAELGSKEEEIRSAQAALALKCEELTRELTGLSSDLSTTDKNSKEVVGKLESVSSRKHEKQLARTDWRARKESLCERFYEDFQQKLESLPEESVGADVPLEVLRDRLKGIDKTIGNIGPLNMEALVEYPQTAERYEFTKKQVADLTQAKMELEGAILQINKNAHEQFMKTFEQARENFQKLFAELFEGGQADLILESTEDPLEPDLKIVARPKGKKLVTIQQLSGGEKALTAISLLFALYLVKPSPFCILDEIDAPLDDANIDRFLSIIRKFSTGDTQFIVITHNKRTMEAADVLYGVTMEKTGISKIVSVRLEGLPLGAVAVQEVAEISR